MEDAGSITLDKLKSLLKKLVDKNPPPHVLFWIDVLVFLVIFQIAEALAFMVIDDYKQILHLYVYLN